MAQEGEQILTPGQSAEFEAESALQPLPTTPISPNSNNQGIEDSPQDHDPNNSPSADSTAPFAGNEPCPESDHSQNRPDSGSISQRRLSRSRPTSSLDSSFEHVEDPYFTLSNAIANETLHSATIFRRFDQLTVRNLLYLESELLELEIQIQEQDECSMLPSLAAYLQNWPIVDKEDEHGLGINEIASKRRDLVLKVRSTLREYQKALKLAGDIFSLKEPYKGDVKTNRSIVRGNFAGEKKEDLEIFEGAMNDHLDDEDDLCILARNVERDLLTTTFETKFSYLFYDGEKTNRRRYKWMTDGIKYFSTSLAVVWLVCAIVGLYYWRSDAGRLALFSILTLFFAFFVALLTTARTHDIYAAIATFAAVLVVFIGTALNQSGQTGDGSSSKVSTSTQNISLSATRTVSAVPARFRRDMGFGQDAVRGLEGWPDGTAAMLGILFCGVGIFCLRRRGLAVGWTSPAYR